MSALTLTPDYKITFPDEMRADMRFQPGTRFEFLIVDDVITLVPVKPMSEIRGFLKMKDTEIEREEEDRL